MDQLPAFFTLAMKADARIFSATRFDVFKTGGAPWIDDVLVYDPLVDKLFELAVNGRAADPADYMDVVWLAEMFED